MPPKNVPKAKPRNSQLLKPSTTKSKSSVASSQGSRAHPAAKKPSQNVSAKKTSSVSSEMPRESEMRAMTIEDEAAIIIQSKFRQHLAKKQVERLKNEKQNYDQEMERLEKEAFLHLVKLEQEEAERKRQKEDEERKRKQEELKRRKRMLEASFDGDLNEMKQIVKEVSDIDDKNGIGNDVIGRALRTKHTMAIIDCEDANGNTALSEAANGGHADAIKYLIERGADPNSRGQFLRTPLYRAAFAGHLEAVQVLLENGADPRIYAQDNTVPAEIASTPAVIEVLEGWDISRTETVQKQIEAAKEKRAEEDRKRREAETSKLEDVVAEAKKDYEAKQKMLDHAYCELNKRITEHDTCVAQGFQRLDITLQSIQDQEFEVESIKLQVETARDNLAKARLRLRESMASEDEDVEDNLPGLKVTIKELDDVLFRDVGNRMKESGKWPLLIDPSGQAATFLRYRDTNYICAVKPSDMEDNNVRRCLIGAIRFGKPFIVDMMEVDMYDTCVDRFDSILKNLMNLILDKSILKEENYLKLIKKEDGPEYDRMKFNDLRISNFKFMLVTKNPYPQEKLMDLLYVLRVVIPV